MAATSPQSITRRWFAPIFLGLVAPILVAVLSGAPARLSATDATGRDPGERTALAAPDRASTAFLPDVAARVASNPIEVTLGQLDAHDEALLHEPILGMRLAAAVAAGDDPWSDRQLAHWADLFAARLNEAAIPQGTRATLAWKFAVYQHDLLLARQAPARDGR